MHYHLSVLSTGGQKQASEDVCQAMSVFVGLSLPTSQVLPTPQCLLSPHTLLVRKSWLLELTDGFTGLYCVALIFRAFISLLSWPPIYLPHSEAVGSPDLELSTSSHICLVCKSIYCCIHSFPMCFTGTPKKTVTSGIGSGHSQLSSHLCNCFFQYFRDCLMVLSPYTLQQLPTSFLAVLMSIMYAFLGLILWVHFSFFDTFPAASSWVLTFVCVFLHVWPKIMEKDSTLLWNSL